MSLIAAHLYCGSCRSTGVRIVRDFTMELVKDAETGGPLPLPDVREWKRAAALPR